MVHGSAHFHLFPVLLLAVLSLPVLSYQARAEGETLRIATIELGTGGRFEDGRPTGFCYDLGNALAREAGFEPVNRLVPLARGVEEVVLGLADMIIVAPDERIDEAAENIGLVETLTIVAWGRVETPLRSKRDLAGKTVALVRGSRLDRGRGGELRIVRFPCRNHELGFKMLMAGRVDAVIGPIGGLAFAAEKVGVRSRFLGEPLVIGEAPVHVYVSKRLPRDARNRLRRVLKRFHGDGTVTRLRNRYPL
ncbi:substrate-binding periplasmic protein [Desulfovibrio sp. Fe33]|uniref:substrate-binding periplasmic protein n=1 Tax=Desulfovibrio sp. Fe33 TaxID=3020842 RepID=UPI00234CEAAF|nr:transporter substrate-binding domain-containing protein [Desulfovibrio sp. Fe33]